MRRFTQIAKLTSERRLPRLGKIRLGIRVKKGKPDHRCNHQPGQLCNYCSYPKETPHFVVPDEVAKVYGNEPTELDIMLPVDKEEVVFPQAYEYYGFGRGLKCTGNGQRALRMEDTTKELVEMECPCPFLESGDCSQRGHLAVILPKVSVGGIYQIDTSSFNSIIDINSGLAYVKALIGRFAMVPLRLSRVATDTHHDGKRQTHYTLRITLEGNVDFVNQLRGETQKVLSGPQVALPAPVHDAMDADSGVTIEPAAAQETSDGGASAKSSERMPEQPASAAAQNAGGQPTSQPVPSPHGDTVDSPAPRRGITLNEAKVALLSFNVPKECADYFNQLPNGHQRMLRGTFKQHVAQLNGDKGESNGQTAHR